MPPSLDTQERERLVNREGYTISNNAYAYIHPRRTERRTWKSFIGPVLVVILALIGIALYFIEYWLHPEDRVRPKIYSNGLRDAAAPTILVSIDGFRYDYLSRTVTRNNETMPIAPNIQAIAKKGVMANGGMQPVVPTKTFPNHASLVTGLWPASTGIVGNTMYDPVKKSWFHLDRMHPDWWHGSPIWLTLKNSPRVLKDREGKLTTSDKNYTTACVFWPGSDVPKQAPNAFWKYNGSVSYEDRVDRAVSLLKGKAEDLSEPADFVTLYFEGVDHAGHRFGPNSKEVDHEIERVDKAIGEFIHKLGYSAESEFEFNVIVLADHGFTEISNERSIDLTPTLEERAVQDVVVSPFGLFLNTSISSEETYARIYAGFKANGDHAAVYRKEDMPERWHLKETRLITPVVTMADLGWTVEYPHQHVVPDAHKPLDIISVRTFTNKGNHGFDNNNDEMQALFVARGPAFREGETVNDLRVIDIYEMICHIFKVQPAPNNGSLDTTLSTILMQSPN